MAHQLTFAKRVVREFMYRLRPKMGVGAMFADNVISSALTQKPKVGGTVQVKVRKTIFPQSTPDGDDIPTADVSQDEVDCSIRDRFAIQIPITAWERVEDFNAFADDIINPVVDGYVETLEKFCTSLFSEVPRWVGVPGTPDAPDSLADFAAVERALNEDRVPMSNRNYIASYSAWEDLRQLDFASHANVAGDGGRQRRGTGLDRIYGMAPMWAPFVPSHTAGTFTALGTSLTVGVTAADASSITIDDVGGGTETLVAGDLMEIDGGAGNVQQFVVTADATAVAGEITVSVYPKVEAAIPDNSGVTFVTDHTKNFAGVPSAIAVGTVVGVPSQTAVGSASMQDGPFSILTTVGYDHVKSRDILNFEAWVYGKVLNPHRGRIVLGAV